MPSKPKTNRSSKATSTMAGASSHLFFLPLLACVLVLWSSYRVLSGFPVWFDEIISKAIFFGLPVIVYITVSGRQSIADTFAAGKLKVGLMQGVAFGGILGFAAAIASLFAKENTVQTAMLFASNAFWWEFFLSLVTSFWETLFFFSFVMVAIMERWSQWHLFKQIIFVASIFLLFHLPNIFLRFPLEQIPLYILLMFVFALGQGFIFSRHQNGYSLVVSQSIWGMALLVHLSY